MMVPEWEAYLDKVTSFVRFAYDRPGIREEMRGHLEDRMEDFMEAGMEREEAQCRALEVMGDAKEIGEALDKEHSPLLGWIWRVIHWAVIAAAVLLLPTVFNFVLGAVYSIADGVQGYHCISEDIAGELVYAHEPDVRGRIDNVNIVIDEVRRYEDGTVQVCYRTWHNPLDGTQDWSFGFGQSFYDENRDQVFYGGGGSSGGLVSRHTQRLNDFPQDSQILIIDYDSNGRRFYAEIPLTEEAGGINKVR